MTPFVCHINLARGFRGGERQTELLIRALQAQGYRQRLVARRGDVLLGRMQDLADLECIALSPPFSLQPWVCRGADILQVHEAKAGHLACVAHSCFGLPYVITRRVDKPPRTSFLNQRLYANAAAVVAVSGMIRDVLFHGGLHRDAVVIADAHSDLPVNREAVAAIRERFKDRFLIGHAGALVDRHKGQGTLIQAMRLLAGELPVQLLLMGSGPDEASLRAAASGLENVSFEGFADNLGDYMAALDLFAYPSNFEGLGSALLDAMQAGLPIIASDVGGIPEIVEAEKNGLLVPPGDAEALANAIRRLYQDAELRNRLASSARDFVQAYSPAAMAQRYAAVYASALQG